MSRLLGYSDGPEGSHASGVVAICLKLNAPKQGLVRRDVHSEPFATDNPH